MTTTDYFTKAELEMVTCPRCNGTGKGDRCGCKLCTVMGRVYTGMAAAYAAGGLDGAWSWFYAKLDAKIGSIRPGQDGRWKVETYTLINPSAPDTYRNRKWFTFTETYATPVEAARAHFGTGRLRPEPDHFGALHYAVLC